MAARTLNKMRKAQSLIRDCHSWFVQNDEIMLAVELCQIEGNLALFFENKCFANSPCPGLQDEEFPRIPPFDSRRRGNHRVPYNDNRRPRPTIRSKTEVPESRANRGQKAPAQATASKPRGIVRNLTCPNAGLKTPEARAAVTRPSPPTGVLLDFENDVEIVKLPLSMVADMKPVNTANLGPKGEQRLPECPAAVEINELGLEGLARQVWILPSVSIVPPRPVDEGVVPVPSQAQLPDSPVCDSHEGGLPCIQANQPHEITGNQKEDSSEEYSVMLSAGGSTEGRLVVLDGDVAVILPSETDTDTNSTTHPEGKDVLAGGLDPRTGHNPQPENLEDREIIFQENVAKGIRPDFKALFVSSDDDSPTSHRAIDLRAILNEYSEVIICK
ncbi:uncharacterized protein N7500_005089 [Penicillium coprophilum]|uniref:uncharacterized protein n=1 Tax=Penicillium coprophilum TaxID=36646 RepID=UPI0023932B17|nr:uncharacterized protein N7500_005089 [Penicillium coprophilum]KAJ5163259.1 hypothetical protein N7500_005089 [Penicillium coprophilum]